MVVFSGKYRSLAGLGLLLATVGCGTADYEARLENTVAQLKKFPPLIALAPYFSQPLEGTEVNLRKPSVFGRQIPKATGEQPTAPEELYPAGVPMPAHQATYEAFVKDDQGTQWYYNFVICAAQVSAGEAQAAVAKYLARLQATVPQTPEDWGAPLEIETPEGVMRWRPLRVEAKFQFPSRRGDHSSSAEHDGVLELLLLEGQGHLVILGTKTMQHYEEFTEVGKLLRQAASTLQIGGEAPVELTR